MSKDWTLCLQLRKETNLTLARASNLHEQIASSKGYEWARKEQNQKALDGLVSSAKAGFPSAGQELLVEDPAKWKKKCPEDVLILEMALFMACKKVHELTTFLETLVSRKNL